MESISSLLEWDNETYMPPDGAMIRSQQIELMASLAHKEKTSHSFEAKLRKLYDLDTHTVIQKGLSFKQKAALREWGRDFKLASALPNPFVKEFARLTAESLTIWTQARQGNDFSLFAPYLEKIVKMLQKKTDYLGYEEHPYDALLNFYEPDLTVKKLNPLFSIIKEEIQALLKTLLASPQVDESCLHGKFSSEKQLAFGKHLLEAMGCSQKKGRLDLSTHPFSMAIHPFDSRVTTRIHPSSVFDSISSVLHEGGHSLYEMGLDPEYYGSPICEAASHGIHESQSRLWETRIGQSKPFWKYFLPRLAEAFPQLRPVTLDQFYKAINQVSPAYIRVESDEVTYSLHIILRYELEKKLIGGTLKVREIPEAWNEGMKSLLGVLPPSDKEGCLQDVHWSIGAIGYFPTYALGNLYTSQFFDAFEKDYPQWHKKVEKGELLFVTEWLRENIHRHGRAYRPDELIKRVTGKTLSAKPYLDYLNNKYKKIY